MLDAKKFAQRLLCLRRRANLRQLDVAERCLVSAQAVSKWERGHCCPDLLLLDDLASALGVEIRDLFEEENETKDGMDEVNNG